MGEDLSSSELEAIHHRLSLGEPLDGLAEDFEVTVDELLDAYSAWAEPQALECCQSIFTWLKGECIPHEAALATRRRAWGKSNLDFASIHDKYMRGDAPLRRLLRKYCVLPDVARDDYARWLDDLLSKERPGNLNDVCRRRGWNVRRLRKIANRTGGHPRDLEYIKRRYNAGDAVPDIAHALALSTSYVTRIIKREGWWRGRTVRRDSTEKWISALCRLGFSRKDTARYMGVSVDTVRAVVGRSTSSREYSRDFKVQVMGARDKNGWTIKQTAAAFDIPEGTVSKWRTLYNKGTL